MRILPGTVLYSVGNVLGGIDNNRIKLWNIPYYKHKSQFESWKRWWSTACCYCLKVFKYFENICTGWCSIVP